MTCHSAQAICGLSTVNVWGFDPDDEATWPADTELRSCLEDAWLAFTPLPECEQIILTLIKGRNQ